MRKSVAKKGWSNIERKMVAYKTRGSEKKIWYTVLFQKKYVEKAFFHILFFVVVPFSKRDDHPKKTKINVFFYVNVPTHAHQKKFFSKIFF